jgi:hypothetical protein
MTPPISQRSLYNDKISCLRPTNGSRCPKGRKVGDKLRSKINPQKSIGLIFDRFWREWNLSLRLYLSTYGERKAFRLLGFQFVIFQEGVLRALGITNVIQKLF